MALESRFLPDEAHSLSQMEMLNADYYKRYLEVVCNNATLAIFIMDDRQQCVYMNPAAEKLTGFSLDEVRGRALHDIIHHTRPDGSHYPLEECPIDRAFPQNNQEQGEEVFVHKNGSFYPVAYTASPIREGSGIVGTIVEVRDITQEKLDEKARQELEQARTAFFSNISHEFRTPLTLMLGSLEEILADSAGLSQDKFQQVEIAHRNSLRLLKLVNTLLDFSRIEAGRTQAMYEPTDLAQLTTELASTFRAAVERAGMRLVVDCPPLSEPVYVDPQMWEKIVLNLLSNAFKFTFNGEIEVSLKCKMPNYIELAVRDTGIGIPPAEIPHLFERFHRVKEAQGRSYEGSGIGLSLVQELVKLHGGTVAVNSTLGQGSCFTVSIPTGSAHLPQDRIGVSQTLTALGVASYVEEALRWLPEEAEEPVRCGASSLRCSDWREQRSRGAGENQDLLCSGSSPRILLADDNADMRNYVKRLLSQRYTVETVPDGIVALNAIKQNPPDLVLTDVMMPKMDGLELLQALRANPQTREIPIILLSAQAGEESRVEGLAAGADDYLTKPFSARELLARVEANLSMAQLRREAAQREHELRVAAETASENLETVLASINDVFMTFDRDWYYTYVNRRTLETSGMCWEDFMGKTLWDVFPDLVDTQFHAELQRAVTEQTPVQFEFYYPKWQRWFENRVYPSANGVSIFTTEITDRKQAEAALRESEVRFRQMAETIHDVFWLWNIQENRHLYISPAYERIWGRDRESIYQDPQQWIETIHPEDRPQVKNAAAQCLQNGYFEQEYRVVRPDGSICWVSDRGFVIDDDNGEPYRVAGVAQDITERKQVEQEREYLLAREQAARESAETANRIKDEFLAVLSHELRSPLNPILGWVKLLQSRKFDEQATAKALATIERNAKLQTQLIEDLLDVSRILRGKMVLNVTSVNLVSVIDAALETVRVAAAAKDIRIQKEFSSEILVAGDSSRLQQIVWNLLSNAVKFTPTGGCIEVQLQQVGTHAQIQVKDTGKGIHPDFLPYVFEYFRQEDGTTTRKFGGLGLGLAIVRQITELHGGSVKAESLGEGQGATFTVQLPLLQTAQEVNESDAIRSSCILQLQGVRVLVVDDEVDMQELVLAILEQYGAEVCVAASAAEALLLLNSFQPDILISDIGMPDVDGYMLMRQIRQRSRVPAIALTAYAGEYDQQQALAAGFQNHLAKPVEPEKLVQAIAQFIK
ncbi:PAS/PAC sensor hybrid histidine kinase [Gloeocapsa sp. PCC 7428]|uniref:ATP-binding protein n=1 Tax=Gloeocapsa sp. PCC 7428 TaxID=1173026 RepID=UPI0002A5F256|nr:ATP-binding protein [Gloeocapsa sp. PCC 7428]AFZ33180.1 PAS/PAC sensor hybrid histidine kinase [Gloeocapsa sp. PCC 7428]